MNSNKTAITVVGVLIVWWCSTVLAFPTLHNLKNVNTEDGHRRDTTSDQNKSDESIHAFIQHARENIKIRDFLQNFDAFKGNGKNKDLEIDEETVSNRNFTIGRKRRHTRYVYNTENGRDKSSNSEVTIASTVESAKATSMSYHDTESPLSISNDYSKASTGKKFKDVVKDESFKVYGDHERATGVRSCVHKYNNVAHKLGQKSDFNYEYDGIDDADYNDREPLLSNVTLAGIGEVQVEHCARLGFCYALWSQGEDGIVTILGQGCWESSDVKQSCSQMECRSDRAPSKSNPSTNFCCCKTDLCNASPIISLVDAELTTSDESAAVLSTEPSFKVPSYGVSVSIAGACLGGVVLTVVIRLLCKHLRGGMHKDLSTAGGEGGTLLEAGGPGFSCSTMCVDNLKLHDNIGEGRHGKVWSGSLGGVAVAVKAMPACKAAIWTRERDIYCLPHMLHPNLLTYFGCDTRLTLDGSTEHLLVLQLAPLGSLRQYLIAHTLDWDSYTKMALGIASALAHLHTQIDKNDQYKPCIVHRDVNSSNILVRADLSCCLSDLGLAMALPDSRKKSQQPKIQEAGTLRYLAPEALEGALDLRRCDAALRAVDVYALALVLWELLSRCAPAHRPPGPHPYAPPYHAEVEDQPTLEQMQVVVARRKARPLFSARLLNTRAARLAKDTCEDCWDHDAEARLTALCVVERLTELRNLKPVPSPTINSNDLRPPISNDISNSHSPGSTEDKNSNLLSSITNNFVGGNTTSIFDFESLQNQPIQPHQGRNPCLERNLALAGPGDRLIDKSLKDMTSSSTSSSSAHGYGSNDFRRMEQSVTETSVRNEEPQDFSRVEEHPVNGSSGGLRNTNRPQNQNTSSNVDASLPGDLSPGEYRLLARPVTPIGYVQNDVSGENSSTIGNGRKDTIKQTNLKMDHSNKWSTRNIKKLLDSKLFRRKGQVSRAMPLETEVNLVLANGKPINNDSRAVNGLVRTSVILNDTRSRNKYDEAKHNSSRNVDVADRPSSLPGIEAISAGSSRENSSSANDNWRNMSNLNENHTTCTLSPPNQTISMNMLRQNCNENLISGFKELPNGMNGVHPHNQVFAVIVPRTNINSNINRESDSTDWKNKKILLNHMKPQADSQAVRKPKESAGGLSKRHSCDEQILLPGKGRLTNADSEGERSCFITNTKCQPNRNSYSGEYEINGVNENTENFDPNMMDYSSNSEDEHMLLLAENGGSKITMRPRFDVKNADSKNKKKMKHNSNLSIPDSNGSLSKITAGSFTSICNKYGPKSKYENFENENSEHLLEGQSDSNVASVEDLRRKSGIIHRNDVSMLNLVRNGSVLSLCKNEIDDTSFNSIDMNMPSIDVCPNVNSNGSHAVDTQCRMNIGCFNNHNEDNDSSSDDSTLRDSVSLQDNKLSRPLSIKQNLSRQHSLELVTELFSSSGDISRLKDPASRIKTPGDVPASVRRVRGHKRAISMKTKAKPNALNRLSLYDDRIMFGNSL